jgi:tetratricopeptide (TPR) repeat protein
VGGEATFRGTSYQARVIAYAYVHLLAPARLNWLGPSDDTPRAVLAETGGAGDDALIELGPSRSIELQMKLGLTGGARLRETILDIAGRSQVGDVTPILLVVDGGSSKAVREDFRTDLDRLRSGRTDSIRSSVTEEMLPEHRALLGRVHVVTCDVLQQTDSEAKTAVSILRDLIEDESQAEVAWQVLSDDAQDLCAQKLRRTRKDLVTLLEGRGIKVRPPRKDRRWHELLDLSRDFLRRRQGGAALQVIVQLERESKGEVLPAGLQYRIHHQRAAALLLLDRSADARIAAGRALEFEPHGLKALAHAARACMLLGDASEAKRLVTEAMEYHASDPEAWAIRAQVISTAGEPLPDAPPTIRNSNPYRAALREAALLRGDLATALLMADEALGSEPNDQVVLERRAEILVESARKMSSAADARGAFEESERITSSLLVELDETDPLTPIALICRAAARRGLGKSEEAINDAKLAERLNPNDENAVRLMAAARIELRDFEGALQILRRPVVESSAVLLGLRAEVQFELGDRESARADLEAIPGHLSEASDPVQARFLAVETALDLGDLELAKRFGKVIPPAEVRYSLIQARIALAEGRIEDSSALYEEAATLDPPHRAIILAEAGVRQLRAGRPKEAAARFDAIGVEQLPAGALEPYVKALIGAHELVRVRDIVRGLLEGETIPAWARDIAIAIALRQEDVDTAVRHLTELVQSDPKRKEAIFTLAYWLIETGERDKALSYLDDLAARDTLDAREKMQTAELLREAGRIEQAIGLAFRSYRSASHDPDINRAFAGLVIMSGTAPELVTGVAADTHVVLRGSDNTRREYTVYEGPPIDPLRNEIDVAKASAMGLLGKRVGDKIVENAGDWVREEWTIEELVPAVAYSARDVLAHYQERFPDQPFFVKQFHVGDLSEPKDLAPLISSVEARKNHVAQVMKVYASHLPPLGFLAKALSVALPQVMDGLPLEPTLGALIVEWQDAPSRVKSRASAAQSKTVVITRSALHTLEQLGMRDILVGPYRLVAPATLRRSLRRELIDARKDVGNGRKTLMAAPPALGMDSIEAGDPRLVSRVEQLQDSLTWVDEHVEFLPRPLATIGTRESEEERDRESIGADSHDAAELALANGWALYADDLGLRRMLLGTNATSLSTLALLDALVERGVLTSDVRDKAMNDLVIRGYRFVAPSKGLLLDALRRQLPKAQLDAVFALLGRKLTTLDDASVIVIGTIKSLAVMPIQIASIEFVARRSLETMATQWGRSISAQAVRRVAELELALLPQALDQVRTVCEEFGRSS